MFLLWFSPVIAEKSLTLYKVRYIQDTEHYPVVESYTSPRYVILFVEQICKIFFPAFTSRFHNLPENAKRRPVANHLPCRHSLCYSVMCFVMSQRKTEGPLNCINIICSYLFEILF